MGQPGGGRVEKQQRGTGRLQSACGHRPEHTDEMWCSIVLAAVMVAVAGGQTRFRYDGTPLPDDVFVESGPQQVFQPQQVFVPPQPQPVFTVPAPTAVQPPVFQAFPAAPAQQFLPPVVQQPVAVPQTPFACPSTLSLVHTTHQGRFYHFSWCRQPGQVYSHSAARDYCRGLPPLQFGNIPINFDLVRVTGSTDFNFFLRILLLHQIPSFWTRDLASTAPYEVREFITKFGDCIPGQDCLSLEASPEGLFLLENMCSVQKAVICVAH